MSRKHWTPVGFLLVFLKLLWAKLPGPSQTRRRLLLTKKEESEEVEVFDSHGQISQFFSDRTTGLVAQEVKPSTSGGYAAGSRLVRSRVEVKITRPDTAKLSKLAPEVGALLTSGSGQIAIVIGTEAEGKLEVEREFLGEGIGRGTWEMRTRET